MARTRETRLATERAESALRILRPRLNANNPARTGQRNAGSCIVSVKIENYRPPIRLSKLLTKGAKHRVNICASARSLSRVTFLIFPEISAQSANRFFSFARCVAGRYPSYRR